MVAPYYELGNDYKKPENFKFNLKQLECELLWNKYNWEVIILNLITDKYYINLSFWNRVGKLLVWVNNKDNL